MYSLIHYSKSINRLSKHSSKNRAFHIQKKKKNPKNQIIEKPVGVLYRLKGKKNRDKRKVCWAKGRAFTSLNLSMLFLVYLINVLCSPAHPRAHLPPSIYIINYMNYMCIVYVS